MSSSRKVAPLAGLLSQLDQHRIEKTLIHVHESGNSSPTPSDLEQLRFARTLGDILIVSIGAGSQAAECASIIHASGVADYVAICSGDSAASAIRMIRPACYVKRIESKVHGVRFAELSFEEQAALLELGIRSQTVGPISAADADSAETLQKINEHIGRLKKEHSLHEVLGWLHSFQRLKVCLVGETIIDEYVFCEALGKSGKEPLLAMRSLGSELHAGGALAIANHLAEFCDNVKLYSYLGETREFEQFVADQLSPEVHANFLYKRGAPTIRKRRYIEQYSAAKMFAMYDLEDSSLEKDQEQELLTRMDQDVRSCPVTICSDFGHGLIGPESVSFLCDHSPFLSVNTQLNSANAGYHTISKYPRADYVSIHEGEMRLDGRCRGGDLNKLVGELAKKLGSPQIMVTRGKHGSVLRDGQGEFHSFPALATRIVDRIGAGDASFAVGSLAAAAGLPPELIGLLANLAGAQAVETIGNRQAISRSRMIERITRLWNSSDAVKTLAA